MDPAQRNSRQDKFSIYEVLIEKEQEIGSEQIELSELFKKAKELLESSKEQLDEKQPVSISRINEQASIIQEAFRLIDSIDTKQSLYKHFREHLHNTNSIKINLTKRISKK